MARSLLISLISFSCIISSGDNTTNVHTKGASSSIHIKQIGYTNQATVYCGLSQGNYTTHTCTRADIDITSTGDNTSIGGITAPQEAPTRQVYSRN